MGDLTHASSSSKHSEVSTNMINKRSTKCSLAATSPRLVSAKMVKRMIPLTHFGLEGGTTGRILLFLLKVAALEAVRRFSRVKCPMIWKVLQGLQILTYSPFKWIQRWAPIRSLVKGMQTISRPLLLLSVASAFSDSEKSEERFDSTEDSQQHSESSDLQPASNLRTIEEPQEDVASENWLLQLHSELEKQGIVLPERINDAELRRFYTAANGDFSCLLRSIRRTIRWRETYGLLSPQELESWSHLVFWHGYDVKLRPCLIIRLGLACTSLSPSERPSFAQAIVSQLEHGVLFLVNEEDPRVTVLMDCEGLSPFRIPMQVMRSCSILTQDHYPNRLGTLFVVRLPPVVRVIAQTFIQILKPTTRKKLQFLADIHPKALSELLESVPSFLGGNCSCDKCETLRSASNSTRARAQASSGGPADGNSSENELAAADPYLSMDTAVNSNCEQTLRTAIVAMLMLWIFIAFLVGMQDADALSFLS
ncbi:hypothetical protein Taro_007115 [Colocasia esculenta]|uniref:CRAL-TRIO domain-containing protein n=1 Tax=Colocasia esculenta TaxID=4460 RepID=A0A843TX83_COLES|nr:hypothetical protein [Colocasia esculenta]